MPVLWSEQPAPSVVYLDGATRLTVFQDLDRFQMAKCGQEQPQIIGLVSSAIVSDADGKLLEKPTPGAGRRPSRRNGSQRARQRSGKSADTSRLRSLRSVSTRPLSLGGSHCRLMLPSTSTAKNGFTTVLKGSLSL